MHATIRDVALRAGVSEATVSRALRGLRHVNPATAEQVRRAADELGFTPSRSAAALATGRSRLVSVAVPSVVPWFYSAVLDGVDGMLTSHGHTVGLLQLGDRAGSRRRLTALELAAARPAAHVVIGFAPDVEEQALLRTSRLPVVTVGGVVDGLPGVGIPEAAAAAIAVEHLAGLGHRRIGHVGGDREDSLNPAVAEARRASWSAAVARLHLESRPSWFGAGDFRIETSRDAAIAMLAGDDRPTAVFAASDLSALGVLLGAQAMGLRVPEDVSVVGIDDHPFAAAHGLTTVRQSPEEQGALAAAMLLRELGARRGALPVPRPIELVVRGTTAPPR